MFYEVCVFNCFLENSIFQTFKDPTFVYFPLKKNVELMKLRQMGHFSPGVSGLSPPYLINTLFLNTQATPRFKKEKKKMKRILYFRLLGRNEKNFRCRNFEIYVQRKN